MTSPAGEHADHEGHEKRVERKDGHDDRDPGIERDIRSTPGDGEDRIEREDRSGRENSDHEYRGDDRPEQDRDPERPSHDGNWEGQKPSPSDVVKEADHDPEPDNRDAPQGISEPDNRDAPQGISEPDNRDAPQGISEEPKTGDRRDPDILVNKDSTTAPADEQAGLGLINLFVRNVAKHVVEDQLIELFSKYGKVDSAVVVRDPHSRECRGFGFVKMVKEDEAAQAIEELRDFEFEGRRIVVEKAKRKSPHSRTPGEYMGIDRRIRDRYAGIKRSRDHEGGYGYGDQYGMDREGGYQGRKYDDDGRGRYDDRGWDPRNHRAPPMRPSYDDRERKRGRYNSDDPRSERHFERENRFREREPPVPREPADDYV